MRSAPSATVLPRANRSLAALGAVFSAFLLLFLAAHVSNCALPAHHDGIARVARSAERAIDAGAVRSVSQVTVAADGNGHGKQVADLKAPLANPVMQSVEITDATTAPAIANNGRNTALAHRRITVLLI